MTSKKKKVSCYPCYLCGFEVESDESLSFFGFPSHETAKALWAEFCGMNVSNVSPKLRLCSRHFQEHDFSNINVSAPRRRNLKPNAVPSLRGPVRDENRIVVQNTRRIRKCWYCKISTNDNDLTFFRFPRDEETKFIWAAFCGITTKDIRTSMYLCSSHFSEDSFIKTSVMSTKRRLLKKKAIPTICTAKKEELKNDGVPQKKSVPHNIRCIICGPIREEKRSFFSFPKDENVRKKWEQFCSRKRKCFKFIIPRLCEKHFTENDILFDYVKDGGYKRLKKDSVPTLYMDGYDPNKPALPRIHSFIPRTYSNNVNQNIISTADLVKVEVTSNPNPSEVISAVTGSSNSEEVICGDENGVIIEEEDSAPVVVSIVESSDMESVFYSENSAVEEATIPEDFLETMLVEEEEEEEEEEGEEEEEEEEEEEIIHELDCPSEDISTHSISPKSLPFHQNGKTARRYVGDWKRTDMECPQLAAKFFDCAQKSIAKKNQLLKRLRAKNARLTQHLLSVTRRNGQEDKSAVS